MPKARKRPHNKHVFKQNLLKTKRRKTNAVIESAIQALDKLKPSQKERKINKIITNVKSRNYESYDR